jgi:hypothetical protein
MFFGNNQNYQETVKQLLLYLKGKPASSNRPKVKLKMYINFTLTKSSVHLSRDNDLIFEI